MLPGEEPRCYQLLSGGTALCSDAFQDCWSLLFFCFGLVTLSKQRSQVGCSIFVLDFCTRASTCVSQLECVYAIIVCVCGGGRGGGGGVVDAIIVCVRVGGGGGADAFMHLQTLLTFHYVACFSLRPHHFFLCFASGMRMIFGPALRKHSAIRTCTYTYTDMIQYM